MLDGVFVADSRCTATAGAKAGRDYYGRPGARQEQPSFMTPSPSELATERWCDALLEPSALHCLQGIDYRRGDPISLYERRRRKMAVARQRRREKNLRQPALPLEALEGIANQPAEMPALFRLGSLGHRSAAICTDRPVQGVALANIRTLPMYETRHTPTQPTRTIMLLAEFD